MLLFLIQALLGGEPFELVALLVNEAHALPTLGVALLRQPPSATPGNKPSERSWHERRDI